MSLHQVGVVCATVVGGQHHEIVAFAHLLVKGGKEVCQRLIGLHIHVIVVFATCAYGMAYGVGA